MSTQSQGNEAPNNASDNLSLEQLIAQRTQRETDPEPEQEESTEEAEETEQTEETEESAEEVETEESEETEEESEEGEEEAPFDIDSLSPEQIQALATKARSRLLKDVGGLRAEVRHLKEQLAAQEQAKPLPAAIPASEIPEPFRGLKTVEEIAAKHAEMEKVAEDTDRILDDHEGYGMDDEIELDGKTFTKRQIKTANRNARDAMTKFLPAMHREIIVAEQRKALTAQFEERISKDLPDVADEKSEAGKLFQAFKSDPLVAQVRDNVKDIAPQLDFLLAHAARSITAGKTLATTKPASGKAPLAKVPESPTGAAAASSSPKTAKEKTQKALVRFKGTGSEEDLVAALAARNSTS